MNTSRILLVDDNAKNIQVLAGLLSKEKYNFEFALNGKDALNWLEEESFDLILLDVMMPEMDGYQVCETVKNNDQLKGIPIIFLTAKDDEESIVKGFNTGGVDYILKPFKAEELLSRVKTHLDLRNSYKIIKNQSDRLKELIATKDKFFSLIAHDLKNPLNGLMLLSKHLVEKVKVINDETLSEYTELINEASKESYDLLNNLLEWSRLQTGIIEAKPSIFSLNKIIDETIALHKSMAVGKNITLKYSTYEETELFADREMIKTVIRNLLSNAIKYTHEGGTIELNVEKADTGLTIEIHDNGIGIKEENLANLFDIQRLHSEPGTNGERGTGLGLILCKEFIELNKGKISVKSEYGKGSIFKIGIPTPLRIVPESN